MYLYFPVNLYTQLRRADLVEKYDKEIIEDLAIQAIDLAGTRLNELERFCWVVVHEYHHGIKPVEYDIREVDENLFLSVLEIAKHKK